MLDIYEAMPQLKQHFTVTKTAQGELQLRDGGTELTYFRGAAIDVLLKLLAYADGTKSGKEIIAVLEAEGVENEAAVSLLEALYKKGVLEDGQHKSLVSATKAPHLEHLLGFLSRYSVDKFGYVQALDGKSVVIVGLNGLGAEVGKVLIKLGIPNIHIISEDTERAQFLVGELELTKRKTGDSCEISFRAAHRITIEEIQRLLSRSAVDVVFSALNPQVNIGLFHDLNDMLVQKRIPWLPAHIVGTRIQVGPFILPGVTACYRCYDSRFKANMLHYDAYVQYEKGFLSGGVLIKGSEEPFGPFAAIGGSLIGIEILKHFLQFKQPTSYGMVLEMELDDYNVDCHYVLKLPRCAVCGIKGQVFDAFQYSKEDEVTEEFRTRSLR